MQTASPRGRPRLLVLVYITMVALLAATVAGVVLVVNEHLRAAALNATAADDHVAVERLLRDTLRPADLVSADAGRREAIERALDSFAHEHGMLAVVIRDADGDVRYGGGPSPASVPATTEALDAARTGDARAELLQSGSVLVEHLPVRTGGETRAVVSLERDAAPILAAASVATRDVLAILAAGAAVLALLLLVIFRTADQLLARRTAQLIEAGRRDTLTGLLNHGTVVDALTAMLETARGDGGWILVAYVDVDGFRLLNETHGYGAGDRVLHLVAELLAQEAPSGSILGRSGPDEFLLIGPPSVAPLVRPAVERVRARLASTPLRFEGAAPLKVTVSAGVASYPEHAASASELLAVAGVMLADARTGGGDRVRVDAPDRGEPPERWQAFNVLEGLITAVDAKDRYTRRHSQQVARYAVWLAERMAVDAKDLETVRHAALLHDVGKIGVPDTILRKPARLTPAEGVVMERHAALGDAVVASLPGMEDVALGVRHHHERWDGDGYPDRLIGTDIPLAARIIAVADVFSALTTSRAYRRALPVEEALAVVLAGAGAQFDPGLTEPFAEVIRRLPTEELALEDESPVPAEPGSRTEAA
jgi:diguanylate cyclase (GGDEF)-like protein/putative nucleotidyltransferase with HDIG domain